MAISFYACYQFFTKSPRVWDVVTPAYKGRGSGTFIYPNHLAGFLEMLMPLGWCYVLMGRLSHVTKIFLGYATLVMLAGIGVTLSRGGWVVTGVELVVLCGVMVSQRDFRLQGLALLAVLLVAGVVVIPRVQVMQVRFEQIGRSGKADDLRLALWKPAVKIWRDNFWWGAGPAHFDYRFPQYRPEDVQMRPVRAHNDYLNTLVDWGVVGAFLVASAWVMLYWGVFKIWRTVRGGRDDFARKKSTKFALLVGGAVGLFGILLHSLVDFNMQIPANAILAVTLMALLSSQWRYATERFWWRADGAGKWIATLFLLAGIGCFGAAEWRSAREYFQLRKAESAGQPPNQYSYARIAALEKAFELEPMNFETAHEIAECYRMKSWDGGDDYVPLARKAMDWYQRGTKLNRYGAENWLDMGMCLDWIGPAQGAEDSAPYYDRANELDPNGYFTTANTGWHYVQTGDLAAARTWFERSQTLEWLISANEIAYPYLPIVERRLKEAAEQHTNSLSTPQIER
jgi:O-antigen ligase